MKFSNSTIVSAGDMSQTNVWSTLLDFRYRYFAGISATWTGTPTGTLQLMASTLIPAPPLTSASVTAGLWQPIGTTVQVQGAAGNTLFDLINTGTLWLAVLYTKTSGTGALTVTVSTKGAS